MISFPNAKINLGLRVTGKRSDGFHDIETVFLPVSFCDMLELVSPDKNSPDNGFWFSTSGIAIPGTSNLCEKAFQMMCDKFPEVFEHAEVLVHLHKLIPIGAGLGGGSSDGAFMLDMLNQVFKLGLNIEELSELAARLGSDCPFFLQNIPLFAKGRGNEFEKIDLFLKNYSVLLVLPAVHVSTPWAYSQITPVTPEKKLKDLIRLPIEDWKENIVNDFEKPVFVKYPQLRLIKEKLYSSGALYASMSGSGSAFYGIFSGKTEITNLFPGCSVRWTNL